MHIKYTLTMGMLGCVMGMREYMRCSMDENVGGGMDGVGILGGMDAGMGNFPVLNRWPYFYMMSGGNCWIKAS